MNVWHAVLYGIVEGMTEFLPVSSTAHLLLTSKILQQPQTEFLKTFQIAIQSGAILAVLVIFWRRLLAEPKIWVKILTAFIPTAVIGLVLYRLIKGQFLADTHLPLWALFIGGFCLILFELFHKEMPGAIEDVTEITWRKCIVIGVCQALAVIPGVSRAAATIIGGLLIGLHRKTIVEFSFLLAVPTLLSATALDLFENGMAFSGEQFHFLMIGFFTSFVVAIFSIEFLIFFIRKHSFIPFGVYRIVLALVFWFVIR